MIKLSNILKEEQYGKRLVVFDFDDTLATSQALIYLTKADGTEVELDPAEYATYEQEPGDKFDFKDFNGMLKNPQTIDRNMKLLKKALSNKQNKVTILTARSHGYPMKHFFKTQHNIDPYIVPVGHSSPQKKADWIEAEIKKGYNKIFFIDDSQKNVDAVASLKDKYPNIILKTVKAQQENR